MKTITYIKFLLTIMAVFGLFLACGSENGNSDQAPSGNDNSSGFTEFELEHGIGPITERIEIADEINPELAEQGQSIFAMKCEACHNMEGRMVGPALGDVLDRRSPEFVMNFILNPSGMAREHPVGQELLQEYMTPMPFQNVSESEARAIVEYLRDYSEN
jgi:mono/diheme cytochrome c family protein